MLNSYQTILQCCVLFHLKPIDQLLPLVELHIYICLLPPKCGSGFHGGIHVMWVGRFPSFRAYGVCSFEIYIYIYNGFSVCKPEC
jgi:hypothetical protein